MVRNEDLELAALRAPGKQGARKICPKGKRDASGLAAKPPSSQDQRPCPELPSFVVPKWEATPALLRPPTNWQRR